MQDLRLAIRTLLATPIVSAIAILSLALGIGANTAIFSLVDALLLRSLPVRAPERLVSITTDEALKLGLTGGAGWNLEMWQRFREHRKAFDGAFAWSVERLNLARGGETQPADGLLVDGDFFGTLGVSALLGRTFTAADDVPGGGRDGLVAVISYGFWQRRYGGAVNAIGQPIVVADTAFTIVGVTPPGFFGLDVGRTFDVALPSAAEDILRPRPPGGDRRSFAWQVVLRLKAEQSMPAATATLRALHPAILGVAPDAMATFHPSFLAAPMVLAPVHAGVSNPLQGTLGLRQRYSRPLLVLLVVVALVLLVACGNIANLLLARSLARRSELSVRRALGASPWRLARQQLTESLVLAVCGGVAGVAAAWWGSALLVSQLSVPGARVVMDRAIDGRVLLFTLGMSVLTAVIFGAAPALRAARAAPLEAMRGAGRGSSGGRLDRGVSAWLIVGQAAVSLVLVVAAGLLVGSFTRLVRTPAGFDADRLLVVDVDTRRVALAAESREAFYQRLAESVREAPGVAEAAAHWLTPSGGYRQTFRISLPGTPERADSRAAANIVTPGWFATYGVTLRAGRDFDRRDLAGAPPVLVVNEAFARRFLAGRDPLGQQVANPGEVTRTIVGVVSDALYGPIRDGAPPTMYLALAQSAGIGPPGSTRITVTARAASGPPAQLARSVAASLASVDDDLAFSFRVLADDLSSSLAQERIVAGLAAFFGGLALLLAGLGLYGITSSVVTARRDELGVRLALGAEPRGLVRLVVTRVLGLVMGGVVVGVAMSAWLSRFVAPLLFGVQPREPTVFVMAIATLLLLGLIAAWLPALRIARIAPAEVLRNS
jgi:putative ABC transport system permease protein